MTRDNDRFDLSRRTYLRGIAAATALGAGAGSASAAVDPSTVVEVGEGSYTTQIPSGYGYATPMTSEDIFTTSNEEPPLPSNDWWSGLHLGYNVYDSYTYKHANGATVALPYYGYPSELGLSLQIPNNWKGRWQGQDLPPSKLAKMDDDETPRLFIGHSATSSFADTRVHEYGDWSVTARWGDGTNTQIDMTMVRGTPFVFAEYEGGGAEISLYERYQSGTNGADTASQLSSDRFEVWADQGNVLGVTIYPDEDNTNLVSGKSVQHFGLYAPADATWNGQGTPALSSDLGSGSYLTVATLPDQSVATLEEFGQYAYNHITDTHVDWQYRETDANGNPVSEVETTFSYDIEKKPESATADTLAGLFPHQYKHSDQALTGTTFWSPKGDLKIAATDQFTTTLRYPGILPFMPDAGTADQNQLQSYVDSLHNDYGPYEAQGVPNEAYWAGKDLMRNSAAIPIAEQLGDTGAKDYFLEAVQGRLETFFDIDTNSWSVEGQSFSTAEHEEFTYYHDDLGIFQTYPGGEFGAVEAINDHHLQFGYFIYVASEVARQNPEWAQQDQYGGIVELMIREYANWDHPDKSAAQDPSQNPADAFPFLRTFSPYIGHSYAGGIQGNDWGANQESASEAVNAYAALIRWGEITGNEELRDTGIYLYTQEITGMWEYWFDQDEDSLPSGWGSTIEPPGYRAAATGNEFKYSPMAWDTGYWRNVYWNMSDAIELYGINWIPVGGHSFFLGKNQQYAQENWDRLIDARSYFSGISDPQSDFFGGWEQAAVAYRAMSDPSAAVDLLSTELPMEPEGNSSAFTYQFAHVMNGLGTPDHTVVADTPFYQVFDDDTSKTYVAYNASDTATTVRFSDGASMQVPANSMATSDGSGDLPATFGVSGLSPTSATVTQGDTLSVSGTVSNSGDLEGTQTVELRIDGAAVASQSVTLAAGASTTVQFSGVDTSGLDAGAHTHGVYSADDSATGTLTVETAGAATFGVSGLSPTSATVTQGDALTVSAMVDNTGSADGTQTVELRADGTVLASQSVTLAAGASTFVEFTGVDTSGLAVNTYTHGVYSADDSATGSLTVEGDADTTAPTAPSGLTQTNASTTSVSVSWDPSSDSGGSGLNQYYVYVDGTRQETTGVGTTSATITGLSAGAAYDVHVTAIDGAGNESVASSTIQADTDPASDPGTDEIVWAANAGGDSYTAADGTAFSADANVSGGATAGTGDAIVNTTDDTLYQTERYGDFTYDIPVADGTYDVRLHFAETFWTANGDRVFDVAVEGTEVISDLDVHAVVGHDAALVETVSGVEVTDGSLTLDFVTNTDNAKVSAIEVVAVDTDTAAPSVPANLSQDTSTTDSIDLSWDPSSDTGGSGLSHYNVYVDGTKDQEVAAGTTSATLSGLSSGTDYQVTVTAVDGAGNESAQTNTTTMGTATPGPVAAVNCGGGAFTATDGTEFVADTGTGGGTYSVSDSIANTDDDTLYQSVREGNFSYSFDVANGTYEVRLHFAELWFSAAGDRVFSIEAEGTTGLSSYDIYAAAGDRLTATQASFTVEVTDGTLDLSPVNETNQAHLAGIEILTASADR